MCIRDRPDGIPDKYQKKVTFKVVKGTWTDKKMCIRDSLYTCDLGADIGNEFTGEE